MKYKLKEYWGGKGAGEVLMINDPYVVAEWQYKGETVIINRNSQLLEELEDLTLSEPWINKSLSTSEQSKEWLAGAQYYHERIIAVLRHLSFQEPTIEMIKNITPE